jgi:hypothetical protein
MNGWPFGPAMLLARSSSQGGALGWVNYSPFGAKHRFSGTKIDIIPLRLFIEF